MQIGILKVSAILSPNFVLPKEFSSLEFYKRDFHLKYSAMELRRMGVALKCALSVIESFGAEMLQDIPIVFSSFSGEIRQCVGLLKQLKENFVSPTAFSLSVLNATPAQIAILFKNNNEISSISAENSLEYGLIESYIKPNDRILLINYEEMSKDLENFSYYALGLLLDKNFMDRICTLNFSSNGTKYRSDKIFESAFYLLQNLNCKEKCLWSIESDLKWDWALHNANY